MGLVWQMIALWRLEMYNLTLRIMSSLISSVFYSIKRCLFDFNCMTRLIRTRRWHGHFRSFSVRINGVLLYQTVKWCKCTREDLPFFMWEPRRKNRFLGKLFFLDIWFATFLWNSDGVVFFSNSGHFLVLLKETSRVPPLLNSLRVLKMLEESISVSYFLSIFYRYINHSTIKNGSHSPGFGRQDFPWRAG